jgi:hypothetical protein
MVIAGHSGTTDGKFQFYLPVRMSHLDRKQSWGQRLGWLSGELLVVFAGVSVAFIVETYRDNRNQIAEMHRAVAGIISELATTGTKALKYSDAILAEIPRWEDADRAGKRAVPGYYRIPGAPHPPAAAWNSAVASGIARMLEPWLRRDLGYFTANSLLFMTTTIDTTNSQNVACCQGVSRAGRVLRTRRTSATGFSRPHGLAKEFAENLRRLSGMAQDLCVRLEAVQSSN